LNFKNFLRKKLTRYLNNSAYSRSFFTLYGVAFKEIRLSFRQFFSWKRPITTLFRTLAIIFSALVRLLLGRNLKYSFAYTGEDRILEGIYKPLITENGYYVDVGCNHPKFLSNTYGLYRKGWRGICVDANPLMIRKFDYLRPGDIAVCALVSDEEGEKNFYTIENNVLSTVEIENLRDAEKQGLSYQTSKLQTRTLTSILDENECPNEIGILSVDVEEHDLNVLKSLDFDKYSPKVIIVEDETYQVGFEESSMIYSFLKDQGYDLVGFVLTNLYFLRKEK